MGWIILILRLRNRHNALWRLGEGSLKSRQMIGVGVGGFRAEETEVAHREESKDEYPCQ